MQEKVKIHDKKGLKPWLKKELKKEEKKKGHVLKK